MFSEAVSSQEKRLSRIELLVVGLYIAGGATLGYIVSLLNTVIGKLWKPYTSSSPGKSLAIKTA